MLGVELSNGFEKVQGSDGRERIMVRAPRDLVVEIGCHLLRRRCRLSSDERAFLAYADRIKAVDEAIDINPRRGAGIRASFDEAAGWRIG